MRKIIALFIIVLMVSLLFAQTTQPPQNPQQGSQQGQDFRNSIENTIDDMINYATSTSSSTANQLTLICNPSRLRNRSLVDLIAPSLIGLVVILLFTIFLYMVDKMLMAKTRGIVPIKIEELIVTVLVMLVFFALYAFVGGSNYVLYKRAIDYSIEGLNKTFMYATVLSLLNFLIGMFYTISIPIPLGGTFDVGLSVNVGVTLKPLVDAVGFSLKALTTISSEWVTRYVIICIIPDLVFYIFFPLGIIFRNLSFSRGAGNALIALSFALFFFYPIVVHISYTIFESDNLIINNDPSNPIYKVLRDLKVWFGAIAGFLVTAGAGGLGGVAGYAVRRVMGFLVVPGVFFFASVILLTVLPRIVTSFYYFVIVYGFVLPAINIFLTLTLATEISRYLGSPIDLGAFAKLL